MQNCDISPTGTLHSSGVVTFISQDSVNNIAIATTNLPRRVKRQPLVAFAICRLFSVIVARPAPIALCN